MEVIKQLRTHKRNGQEKINVNKKRVFTPNAPVKLFLLHPPRPAQRSEENVCDRGSGTGK